MPNSQFVGTIFNGGLRSTHYFNGRLLTADALEDDQNAVQTREHWLGKANGYGVIDGLLVSKTPNDTTQISITQGIGLNHDGQIISLPKDVTFAPISPSTQAQQVTAPKRSEDVGQFVPLAMLQQQAEVVNLTSPGVYLLTIEPISHFEGQVATKAASNSVSNGTGNTPPGFGNRWSVEGVRFKIIRLDDMNLATLYSSTDLEDFKVSDNTRQNLLAHWCYGTLTLKRIGRNPFLFNTDYSPLETLPDLKVLIDLDSSDLPLAVFHWNGTALTFVDQWSVRRRVVLPDALSGTWRYPLWKALVSDEHRAENQARFLQFQDQLDALIQSGRDNPKVSLSKVHATDYFGFLPPVGFLPVTYESLHNIVCSNQSYQQRPPEKPGTGTPGERGGTGSTGSTASAGRPGMLNFGRLFSAVGGLGALVSIINPGAGSALSLARALTDPQALKNLQVIGDTLGTLTSPETGQTPVEPLKEAGQTSETTSGQVVLPTTEGGQIQLPIQIVQPAPAAETSGRQAPARSRRYKLPHEIVQEQVCALLTKNSGRNPAGCFDLSTFFHNITLHLYLIGNDSIDFILHQSWNEEAIDLIHAPTPKEVIDLNKHATLSTLPFVIDIYLIEENLRDATAPLYVMFHKAHHPGELIEGYNLPDVRHLL